MGQGGCEEKEVEADSCQQQVQVCMPGPWAKLSMSTQSDPGDMLLQGGAEHGLRI